MSPIKASWVSDPKQRGMLDYRFGRGRCRDLVRKMARGGEAFDKSDKPVYTWLLANMAYLFGDTIFAKQVPGFKMALTHAWGGGEKVFFDLELLHKLDVALGVFMAFFGVQRLDDEFLSGPLSEPFTVDKPASGI